MHDDDAPELDLPDPESVYVNYLQTRCLGIEPAPRDRAKDLMAEWSDAISAGRGLRTTH